MKIILNPKNICKLDYTKVIYMIQFKNDNSAKIFSELKKLNSHNLDSDYNERKNLHNQLWFILDKIIILKYYINYIIDSLIQYFKRIKNKLLFIEFTFLKQ